MIVCKALMHGLSWFRGALVLAVRIERGGKGTDAVILLRYVCEEV